MQLRGYLSTLDDITIPAIYIAWTSDSIGYHNLVGWVDCGSKELTVDPPFYAVAEFKDGADSGMQDLLYYDSPAELQDRLNANWVSYPIVKSQLNQFFSSSQWASLTNSALTHRIGFFSHAQPSGEASRWSMLVRDGEGNTIDELNWLSTRSGGAARTLATPETASVSLSLLPDASTTNTVGVAHIIPLTITNSASSSAHGVTVSLKLNNGFDFVGGGGTQGYSSFDPTSRTVSYQVGPLAGG